MSGPPQQSVYLRARTPPSAHPAPNNIGTILLLMILGATITTLALLGPDVIGEVRRIVECMQTPELSICQHSAIAENS